MKSQRGKLAFLGTLIVLFLIGSLSFFILHFYPIYANVASPASEQSEYVPGRILVKFKDGVTKEKKDKFIKDYNLKEKSEITQIGLKVLELPGQGTEKEYEKAFKENKDVEYASLDYKVKPDLIPNDPYYSNQWHLPKISAPAAWDKTTGSPNIIIAILDTGVDPTHPDLASKLVSGWNTYDNNSDTHDVYGHGTATAGTAAAILNNGVGVGGICGDCKIMPIRMSDTSGYAWYSTASAALTWAADHGARVANMSYMFSNDLPSAESYFRSKGGIITISSGNDSSLLTAPNDPYALTVGATDSSDNRASFSNYGNIIDISGPGVSIYTTANGGSYRYASGTSFSAPSAAGVVGMILSANQSLTPSQVENIIETSADDLGTAGWDQYYGWGRVNVQKAVDAALAGPAPDTTAPTATFTTPTNGQTVSGTLAVKVDVKDNVFVSNFTLDLDSITNYIPTSIQTISDTNKIYNYSIDTNTIINGTHTLNAKVWDGSSNTGTATASINVYNTPDTTAPVVTITSPANGTTLRGTKITISASATDNIAVKRVEIFVDGVLQKTLTSSPYNYSWNFKKAVSGAHTIYARAYDAKGNVGTSSTITVTK